MNNDFAEPLQQIDRVFVRRGGRKLLYFAGCDYYRLSFHPEIQESVREGLAKYGLNTAASRVTTGNHPAYEKLESRAAAYFGAERAVLVSAGYLSNIAVAEGLRGQVDEVFADERCHGSLQDAMQILGCRVTRFRHKDALDLKTRLEKGNRGARVVVATDGVFAFDGSIAPLDEYREAAGKRAILWVDDAHAGGVIGARGQGSVEECGLSRENVIQTITFSKAFGVYGGAVLCDESFRTALVSSSAVAGNTPLPLPLATGVITSLRLLNGPMRKRLQRNIAIFWQQFAQRPPPAPTPIVGPVAGGGKLLEEQLRAAGIYPSFIRYPGGPAEGYFRFALSSEHTPDQLGLLAKALRTSAEA